MAEAEKIVVEIAGQQFRVVPPGGDAERLRRAAALVHEKVMAIEKAGVVSTHRSALLAGLEIALELLALRDARSALSESELREAQSRLDGVLGRLREGLGQTP